MTNFSADSQSKPGDVAKDRADVATEILITAMTQLWRWPSVGYLTPFKLQRCNGRWRWSMRALIRNDYELIVDGFHRSGTSSLAVGLSTLDPELRIRSHCHQAIHVIQAITHHHRGAVVLIRNPLEAIPSAARHLNCSLRLATARYCAYYESLLSHVGKLLVIPFDVLTSDLPATLDAVSARLDLEQVAGKRDELMRDIEAGVTQLPWGNSEATSSWPSQNRELMTRPLRSQFNGCEKLTRRSLSVWTSFLAASKQAGSLLECPVPPRGPGATISR